MLNMDKEPQGAISTQDVPKMQRLRPEELKAPPAVVAGGVRWGVTVISTATAELH